METKQTLPEDAMNHEATADVQPVPKKPWRAPEITSITSVLETQGISYTPGDGISNLTP